MKGAHAKDGTVGIFFSHPVDRLPAPAPTNPGAGQGPWFYLPCTTCGDVLTVSPGTMRVWCSACLVSGRAAGS